VSRVVDLARGWLGTPYVHQASVRGAGTDCLGLVRGLWREMTGAEPEAPPPYTPDWGETAGVEVLRAAALRWLVPVEVPLSGDVLLFRMRDDGIAKHLGILSQAGAAARFIHAYSGQGVVESPLSAPWARRIVGSFRFPFEE
jgi:NlpC/P60 family putative phage cell wall peptidase